MLQQDLMLLMISMLLIESTSNVHWYDYFSLWFVAPYVAKSLHLLHPVHLELPFLCCVAFVYESVTVTTIVFLSKIHTPANKNYRKLHYKKPIHNLNDLKKFNLFHYIIFKHLWWWINVWMLSVVVVQKIVSARQCNEYATFLAWHVVIGMLLDIMLLGFSAIFEFFTTKTAWAIICVRKFPAHYFVFR